MSSIFEVISRSTSFQKLDSNVQNVIDSKGCQNNQKWFVLVLSGSLNPVHNMHLQCLEIAKDHLLQRDPILHRVIGGFLVPSSESYVQHKLGKEAIRLDHRVELCQISCDQSPWISVSACGYERGSVISKTMEEILAQRYPNYASMIKCYRVYGGDFVEKAHCWRHDDVICVAREGHHESLKKVLENRLANRVSPGFLMVSNDPRMQSISSTMIRAHMSRSGLKRLYLEFSLSERFPDQLEEWLQCSYPELLCLPMDSRSVVYMINRRCLEEEGSDPSIRFEKRGSPFSGR